MLALNRSSLLLLISATVSLLSVSCGETKVAQCQKIFTIANQVASETKTLTNGGQEIEMKTWLQAADTLEQAARNLEELNISDAKLQEYQTGFAQMYRDYAEATREIVKARENKDIAAAETAQKQVQQAGKSEQQLGEGINGYCQSKS